jgi:glycosyltransferase involved in cell wall biosynthesis
VTVRLAFVITDSGIGGTEKALLTVLQKLDRSRFEPVGVVVTKGRRAMAERWEATGVPVIAMGMGRWPTPWGYLKLRSTLHKLKPDIVHAFLYHAILLSRLASKSLPWKLITSPRVNYKFAPRPALFIDRWLRRRDAMALCESSASRQTLIELGYRAEKVRVAQNGVDTEAFRRDDAARGRLREEWDVHPTDVVIGTVGRLHRQKGFDVLIRACARLVSGPVRFKVVIAGGGPEAAALRAQAKEANLPVIFLGERLDVPAVLSAFDVYVQASRYEGMSNALLEAMAAGLPCAATAVDGTLDFARDGENLILVRPDDHLALAVAIGYLIEKPDLRRRLSENAIISARNLSVERMVNAFHEAYRTATYNAHTS